MNEKLTMKQYMVISSMLFGLFFGAGNLIFPVLMGQMAGSAAVPAAIGFAITGVGLPLAGIAAMALSESNGLFDMSQKAGKAFAYFFTVALYLTIGPLFAIPRTATVSFQVGVAPFLSDDTMRIVLFIFSLIFFAVVLFFSLRPSGILTWVGKILNPIFLALLFILVVTSLLSPMGSMADAAPTADYLTRPFSKGFLEGYNTMDALASLAFGIILINVIHDLGVKSPTKTSFAAIKSGVFSMGLMALIYCALTFIGAQSRTVIGISADGGLALAAIARHYFGIAGSVFFGIMVTVACAKTSIGLVTAISTTFAELFPKYCTQKKCAVLFSVISFIIANEGLSKIISVSIPVLMFLYPLTIVLIILCIVGRSFSYDRRVFTWTLAITIISAAIDLVASLGVPIASSISKSMPLADAGMGWVAPAILGLVIGLAHKAASSK